MTIAIPVHRALSTKLASRGYNVAARWGYNPWLARVNTTSNKDHDIHSSQQNSVSQLRNLVSTRSYATTAGTKPVGRPKAHTGRASAKKTTRASTSSKPGPKTAAGKKAVGRKPKSTTKAVKTPAKKPAPKKRAVKKPASASTLLAQRRAKDKELRALALLDAPKKLPQTPWLVLSTEFQKRNKATSLQEANQTLKEAALKLKTLTAEEKEHYNHIANQNKKSNETAYKKWLSEYTPEQILAANKARSELKRRLAESSSKRKQKPVRYAPLTDDRIVKQPKGSFIFFAQDRHASGDFNHMTVVESAKLIGREWRELGGTEKKRYDDLGQGDRARYVEEYTSVYGHAPPTPRAAKTAN